MSLRLAIKGFIVVVAVMFGTMANAFAHGGHAHAQMSPTSVVAATRGAPVTAPAEAQISAAILKVSSTKTHAPVDLDQAAKPARSHPDGAICATGACCCQGASSCGAGGHCGASALPGQSDWTHNLGNHMRYYLARLGRVLPDVVIGLDRPPKV